MAKKRTVPMNPTSLDRILKSDALIQDDFEKENYKKLAKFASKVLDYADADELEKIAHLAEHHREELEEALCNVNIH